MVTAFDRIIIVVPDLQVAVAQYRLLLSGEPAPAIADTGAPANWFCLDNTVIELRQAQVEQPAIYGIVLRDPSAGQLDSELLNPLKLHLYRNNGRASAQARPQQGRASESPSAVDHLVLRTSDAQSCIGVFSGELGIRLALDRTVPEWGGRMLFFRAGQMTLEVIESAGDGTAGEGFWGLAYQCINLPATCDWLRTSGIELSEIREGRKPGTRVATLKSHCLGIPTLLIQSAT